MQSTNEDLSDKLVNEKEDIKKKDLGSNTQLTSFWEYKDYSVYRYLGGLFLGLAGGYSIPYLISFDENVDKNLVSVGGAIGAITLLFLTNFLYDHIKDKNR